MSKYKTTGNQTLFDAENAAQKLSEIGNPLEKLDSVIDFEMFRERLEEALVIEMSNVQHVQVRTICKKRNNQPKPTESEVKICRIDRNNTQRRGLQHKTAPLNTLQTMK